MESWVPEMSQLVVTSIYVADDSILTHCGLLMPPSEVLVGSGNSLVPLWGQAIIWTNVNWVQCQLDPQEQNSEKS